MKKILFALLFAMTSAWSNTITVTVPHPPGGAPDVWTRIVAKHLTQELGNDYIIVNKPAADGRIAIDYVASQPADGKNLITTATGPFLFNKVLFNKLNHDYTDFDIMAPMVRVPLVLSVSNSLGVSTLKEFIALAKTKSLNCAGSGASSVFVGKQFFNKINVKQVQFIPFKGSADMNVQLAAGNIDCAFDTTLAALPLHQGGKFKIIAASTESKLSEVPTAMLLSSVVPGLTFYNWYGLGMKINSPGNEKIFTVLRKLNQNPAYQSEMKNRGLEIVNPPEHGSQWIHNEYQKYESMRLQLKIDKLD
jgi:tripartite-type tricarboxylate transporter receptor subunit TctC